MTINIIFGLFFGLCASIQLHLAKGMERYGIEIFSRDKSYKEKGKKPLIYIIGLILNNTVFIYQILGNTFATATIFASVFGIGLIFLMLFSRYVLKEDIKQIEYIGAIFIIIGTIVVGFSLFQLELQYEVDGIDVNQIDFTTFWILNIVLLIIFSICILFSVKTSTGVSLIFGLVAGSCGGLHMVYLHISFGKGLNLEAFLNIIFLLSFIPSWGAFLITQWGFGKKAKASKLVAAFNSSYILIPVFVEVLIISGTIITPIQLLFTCIIIIGVILMNITKEDKEIKKIIIDKKK